MTRIIEWSAVAAPVWAPLWVLASDGSISLEVVMFAMMLVGLFGIGLLVYLKLREKDRREQNVATVTASNQRLIDQIENMIGRSDTQAEALNKLINGAQSMTLAVTNLAETTSVSMAGLTEITKQHMEQSMHAWQVHMGGKTP